MAELANFIRKTPSNCSHSSDFGNNALSLIRSYLKKALPLCNRLAFLFIFLTVFIAACDNQKNVNIIEGWRGNFSPNSTQNYYTVQPGDTLYSIAWSFDMDFRQLAEINHLNPPYNIVLGQKLVMSAPVKNKQTLTSSQKDMLTKRKAEGLNNKKSSSPIVQELPNAPNSSDAQTNSTKAPVLVSSDNKNLGRWLWPTRGHVLTYFSLKRGAASKGIDIGGKIQSPIFASNGGQVVYCGHGIAHYGNLIIIKHNEHFLSAYGHNQIILVREGQKITRGQKIALLGADDRGVPMVHFEIRYNGKPIDPMIYLAKGD